MGVISLYYALEIKEEINAFFFFFLQNITQNMPME